MRIGVLAIQGDIREHRMVVERLGHEAVNVKVPADLDNVCGLLMPGGESTTMIKLMKFTGIWDVLRNKIVEEKFPVFGTCAGMILLSKGVANYADQDSLGVIDLKVMRNGYGRQVDSFEEPVEFNGKMIETIFIRAPKIVEMGSSVNPLITLRGDVILARQENVLVASFHPELTDSDDIHEYFINEMIGNK